MVKNVLKHSIRLSGCWRLVRSLNKHKSVVLMYHGITADDECSDWTQVDLREFEKQMKYLASNYTVISVSDMVEMLERGKTEPYTAAVTFDDGYKSFCSQARPVLKACRVPATIFITSNFVRSDRHQRKYLWPDYVSVLLQSAHEKVVDLSVFNLGRHDISDRHSRSVAADYLNHHLKSVKSRDKDDVIAHLEERYAKQIDHEAFSMYEPMTWDQVSSVVVVVHESRAVILPPFEVDSKMPMK